MEDNLRNRKTSTNLQNQSSQSQKDNPSSTPKTLKFDANRYASRKTFAKNCLNVALLTSNVKQLKTLTTLGPENQLHYSPMVVLVCMSIILQTVMGLLCIVVGRLNINHGDAIKQKANSLNDGIACISLIITVINIVTTQFIAGE